MSLFSTNVPRRIAVVAVAIAASVVHRRKPRPDVIAHEHDVEAELLRPPRGRDRVGFVFARQLEPEPERTAQSISWIAQTPGRDDERDHRDDQRHDHADGEGEVGEVEVGARAIDEDRARVLAQREPGGARARPGR